MVINDANVAEMKIYFSYKNNLLSAAKSSKILLRTLRKSFLRNLCHSQKISFFPKFPAWF